jgi:hypothetical protein
MYDPNLFLPNKAADSPDNAHSRKARHNSHPGKGHGAHIHSHATSPIRQRARAWSGKDWPNPRPIETLPENQQASFPSADLSVLVEVEDRNHARSFCSNMDVAADHTSSTSIRSIQ